MTADGRNVVTAVRSQRLRSDSILRESSRLLRRDTSPAPPKRPEPGGFVTPQVCSDATDDGCRMVEGHVSLGTWGFDSPRRHRRSEARYTIHESCIEVLEAGQRLPSDSIPDRNTT